MTDAPRLLVVDEDEVLLGRAMRWLRSSGYLPVGASTAERARALLATDPYDLMLTRTRLAVLSGVRLMQLAYLERPGMRVVLMGDRPDAMLEMEARRYGARYVINPETREALVAAVAAALPDARPRQRWPRKRLRRQLPIRVRHDPGVLVDVSYGGLCVEMPAGAGEPPSPFDVTVDDFDIQVRAQAVWCYREAGRLRLGAMLVTPRSGDDARWRLLVDLVPEPGAEQAGGVMAR